MTHCLAPALLALLIATDALAGAVTPVRAIRAQSILDPADLAELDEDVPGAFGAIEDAAGLEARVTLYPGRPILPTQVGPPALVERNQTVRMVFARGGLAITAEGRALDRGGVGEAVRVMNLSSRQIVSGAVTAEGSIEVGQ
jgi:flagellar basal body P-ring formation protein FlgA